MRKLMLSFSAVMIVLVAAVFPVNHVQAEDLGFGETVSAESLDSQSGGSADEIEELYIMLNDVNMDGEVANNSLVSTATGSNSISDSAFAGANGMNTVFQNTGNQNILQSSYTINVTFGD